MANKNIHVTHRGPQQWAVIGAGDSRASSLHSTQGAAIGVAREIARNNGSELVIHGQNNLIRAKDSYGPDSFPPKG